MRGLFSRLLQKKNFWGKKSHRQMPFASHVALQQAWSVLKSMYRDPKGDQAKIDHNQNIMRNPMGFDARWCATAGCNAMAKRGSHYCVPCNVRLEEMRENS